MSTVKMLPRTRPEIRTRPRSSFGLVELGLLCILLLIIAPLGWMTLLAFLPNREIVSPNLQLDLWWGNFAELLAPQSAFGQQAVNSLLIALGTVLGCAILGSISGYALSRLSPPRWITLPALGLSAILPIIPPVTLVPGLYLVLNSFGLLGSIGGLVALNIVFNLPFAVLLMKGYFDQLPEALREAAMMDGASEIRVFTSIMLPLVRPGLAAVAIFTAIQAWNEFLFGLTMTTGGPTAPLTVGIASLVSPFAVTWGQMAASGVLAALPIIALTVVAGRHVTQSLSAGAVKG